VPVDDEEDRVSNASPERGGVIFEVVEAERGRGHCATGSSLWATPGAEGSAGSLAIFRLSQLLMLHLLVAELSKERPERS
jgi:hypothetical protein